MNGRKDAKTVHPVSRDARQREGGLGVLVVGDNGGLDVVVYPPGNVVTVAVGGLAPTAQAEGSVEGPVVEETECQGLHVECRWCGAREPQSEHLSALTGGGVTTDNEWVSQSEADVLAR